MKPLLVSSGEPAGIGPDLCLALAGHEVPLVVLADPKVLEERAKMLQRTVKLIPYEKNKAVLPQKNSLTVLAVSCPEKVIAGQLNKGNARYVLKLLTLAATLCQQGEFSALVTAPVHKAIINDVGLAFTGHTEFFADFFQRDVVMLLASSQMKVALMTTHLPLSQVPNAINDALIVQVIRILQQSLIQDFAIRAPRIKVAGLNPHAGESGYLGREEIDVITPALEKLRHEGIHLEGPLPADTLFIDAHLKECDAYVTMYHDQGLPVLKYASFHEAVNVTLGLPIIRTSVDHGTALELAGKQTDSGSMLAAVRMAQQMAISRGL